MIKVQSRGQDSLPTEGPSSTVDLDFDVVYTVLSFLPRRDLVRVMGTCHTLNHAGVRHLLKFRVDLDSTRRMESFCAFMVAQAPLRYPFLRQLSIIDFDPPLSSESVNQLVEILTHASRLEILHLSCFDLLSSEHHLQTACSSLTSIKEFHISWNADPVFRAKDPLYEMVKQMKSPLVKAHLKLFGSDDGIGPDPAVLLRHSSATLEDLEVYYSTFQSELHFPRMRKLSVYEWDYPPPGLIARIFPNLIDLNVSNDYRGDDLSTADDQYRQQSLSVQLAGGGWTSLDQLAGRPADLYKLGLTCQIRRVKIFYVTSRTRGMVAHILSDCRPSHVHILLNQIFPCVLCLPDEVAVRLTYLRCTIDLAYFNGDSSDLDTFCLLLRRSPLTHFMLRLMANGSRITEGVRLIREFRPEAFASQIIASHHSIRYIAIKINYAKPLFWKVLTTESGEVVVDKAPKEDISVAMDL